MSKEDLKIGTKVHFVNNEQHTGVIIEIKEHLISLDVPETSPPVKPFLVKWDDEKIDRTTWCNTYQLPIISS